MLISLSNQTAPPPLALRLRRSPDAWHDSNCMAKLRRYKIRIEDESHLRDVCSLRLTLPGLAAVSLCALAGALGIAGAVIAFTPMRTMLPGYLRESERADTEEGLLRLDSLLDAYNANQAYIDNVLRLTDAAHEPHDSAGMSREDVPLPGDTLKGPSAAESRFVSQMEERERFNISVLAPLAADGIIFSPAATEAVFEGESRDSDEPQLLLTAESGIMAPADGGVVALYHSASERGWVIVMQHARGFLSSCIGTGTPLVGVGDNVYAGQAIALAPTPDGKGRRVMRVRMWHNGLPVAPAEYLMPTGRRPILPGEKYESPRGK